MKFSIGYQLPDEDGSIVDLVSEFADKIGEVYFAMPGEKSGRWPLALIDGAVDTEASNAFEEDLDELSKMGTKLALLFNAACYGSEAVSVKLKRHVCATLERFIGNYQLSTVITTSPFIAQVIKTHFADDIKIRASVNMRIGTIAAMECLSDNFDGFYMQREFNRDFQRIAELKKWCDNNGKTLHLLANSGCLSHCPWQSYHDNLVAHQNHVFKADNVPTKYPSPCWQFLSNRENWVKILQNCWIRPEDIENYEPYFSTMKLATRMHSNPRMVVAAYTSEHFAGNLLDLTEPSYSSLMPGWAIDNTRFPPDWFQRTSCCDKNCQQCSYCQSVLEKVLVNIRKMMEDYHL